MPYWANNERDFIMAWGAIAAAAAAVIGSAMQAKSAKDASKKAKKGSTKEIDYLRESRDIARMDTRHSRQAGATALNALMSMTGLAGGGGGVQYDENGWPIENQGGGFAPEGAAPEGVAPGLTPNAPPISDPRFEGGVERFGGGYGDAYNIQSRAYGGGMPRYGGGQMYNINEFGPENVYSGGALMRNPNPMTIGGQAGYVQPNAPPIGMAGPSRVQLGSPKPNYGRRDFAAMERPRMGRQRGYRRNTYNNPQIQSRGIGGFLNPFKKKGLGFAVGTLVDPVGGKKIAKGQDPVINKIAGEKGKVGSLPNTDWTYNRKGKIAKTGYGHWNNDLGAYVDRRGNKKKNQAAPPTGWEDPNAITEDIDTTLGQDYNFQTDPGYQFRFEEGQRALDRSASASGGLLSGGLARKAMRYGQGFASNEYTNVYNRIAGIAGMGQVANQHAGNAAMQAGQGMGNAVSNAYNARASGQIMQGNAVNQGVQNLGAVDWDSIFNKGGK